MELENLKKEYEKHAKKYKMPNFSNLNRDFEIEKLDKNSDNFLRGIRKIIMEKIVNSVSFLEMLMNPVNAPRMYFPYLSAMSMEDKKNIDNIYGILSSLIFDSLRLEVESEDEREAELIKSAFDRWNEIKPRFSLVLENVKKPTPLVKRARNYFG